MKDNLYKLSLIENELKKRKNEDNLAQYNKEKVHLKQMAFHKCLKKNRWVFGGNRSGKTECGAVETVWLARGIHPFRENKKDISCWVVSLTRQVQRDVAQAKILHYLRKDQILNIVMSSGRQDSADNGIIDFITVRNELGGEGRIGFKSCDQGREKFQGSSLDFVWFDEEPPLDIYSECRMRVLDRCGCIFGTMTPLKGLTWVYNDIYLNEKHDPEIWYEQMEWADNPYLNKNEIEAMSARLSEEELDARRYGKFIQYGGMVYPEFDENINVIDPFDVPFDWQCNIAIDPGLNNYTSVHWYAVDFDGNIYVVAEYYDRGKSVEQHVQSIKEICKRLNWHTCHNGMIEALIDSAANQHTLAGVKSVAELFYDNGVLVNTKVNKDVFTGINRVKSYLRNAEGKSRLFIFRNCPNMIREIKGYYWGNDDSPVKKDDHAMDELRYFIMSRPENIEKIQKNDVQKHKERLIKQIKHKNFM